MPAAVAGIVWICNRTGNTVAHAAGSLVIVMLMALIVVRTGVNSAVPLWVLVLVGLLLGVALVAAYTRIPRLRFACSVLFVITLLQGPIFILWMSQLLLAGQPQPVKLARVPSDRPVVVFVVLDEMSTLAMIDRDRTLKEEHYPNLARLAADGVWFRNGTAVSDYTTDAIIGLIAGTQPERAPGRSTYQSYPVNVCTTLAAAGYRIKAWESLTRFCPDAFNELVLVRPAMMSRLDSLFRDILYLLPHIFLPRETASAMAPIEDRWRDFGTSDAYDGHHRVESFNDYLSAMDETPGILYFGHFMFPHIPYEYDSTGLRYRSILSTSHRLVGNGTQQFHRYMQQTMFVDRLIGQLIDRLEALGVYDESAIVVVADHGVSYRPGRNRRDLTTPPAAVDNDLLKVPMFLKPPGGGGGIVIDTPVSAVDVFPTLMGVLGIALTEELDGRNVLDGSYDRQTLPLRDNSGVVLEHRLDILDSGYDVDWKFRHFDADRGFAPRTPFDSMLLNKSVSDLAQGGDSAYRLVRTIDSSMPQVIFEGFYEASSDHDAPWLAISRADRIVAIAQPVDAGGGRYAFTVLGPAGDAGFFDSADIDVFEIADRGDGAVLRPVSLIEQREP